jgi:Glycosyl hydrolase catalytic core
VRYGKPVYLTEIGITTRSNGTQAQIDQFQKDAFTWMQQQTYVEGAAWFGGFKQNQAPDSFATGKNGESEYKLALLLTDWRLMVCVLCLTGFYKPNGELSNLGYQFGYFNGTSWTGAGQSDN